MAIATGTRLGPYEILAPIGAGGMGEVYRAKDVRLDREVAIKVLPPGLTNDPAALGRFEREARAVAALSHPNILAIHDFGEASGLTFAVLELLEGETLRERLKAGPLSVRKTVEFGVQMARGLSAAHEKGIVHRDVKPENIFVTVDGHVKILDFGLARAGAARNDYDPAHERTYGSHSSPGMVLGTLCYMSPEQARGEPSDQRSDVFALGCVLYEMISGQRAFDRPTVAETMAAILRDEPPDTTAIPQALDRIVRHCLEKRPGERFQSARDLAFALQSAMPSDSGAGLVAAAPSRRARVFWAVAAGVAILTALGAGAVAGLRLARVEPPVFHQLTFNRGMVRSARFSPDGQTFIYGAGWNGRPFEIYSARKDGVGARTFGLPPGDVLGISGSGEMALLMGRNLDSLTGLGTLALAHISGGAPREILDGVSDADLTGDGSAVAVVRRVGGRDRVEFPIGTVLFTTDGWAQHPRISADGTRIAFLDHPLLGDDRGFVSVVDRSGAVKRLTPEWSAVHGLAWSATGREVWFTAELGGEGTLLHAVTLSGQGRVVFAAPVQLQLQDVSRNGDVLLVANRNTAELVGHTPGEPGEHFLDLFGQLFVGGLSSDGSRLAFTYVGPLSGTNYAVCVADMKGNPPVQLGEGWASSISPDGKWILTALPSAPGRLILMPTGSGGRVELDLGGVRPSNDFSLPQTWTRDSRSVLFTGSEAGKASRAYLLDIAGGKPRAVTPENFSYALIAPDGNSLLAGGDGRPFSVFPTGGGAGREVKGFAEGERPVQYDETGDAVYVWNGAFPAAVDRLQLATGRREKWKIITPPDLAGVENGTLNMTPDGSTYVYRYRRLQSELFVVLGLR